MRKHVRLLFAMLTIFTVQVFAQTRTITGKVTDKDSGPLSGISVTVKGTSTGTVTRADGTFTLTVNQNARTLVISGVGYTTREVTASGSSVNVQLEEDTKALEDVVVTGYTKVKKSEYAGAVARVTGEQIRNVPVASFDQLLQGRAPGLSVLSGSGQPGSAATVILRGPTSITGGSAPLYVVDGIPVEAGVFQGINPNDIESVDVLKDASAAALYGSRGAAGVIVVTTRRGQAGKPKFTYSGQRGVTLRPDFNYPMMNTDELLKAQEQLGFISNGVTVPGWVLSPLNPANIAGGSGVQALAARRLDSMRNIRTNWDDIFFRDGVFERHEISASGGTGKTRFFTNLGYYGEDGITYRTDMQRLTWRNNIDYSDDKWVMSFSSNLGYTKRNFQQSDVTNSTRNPFFATRLTPGYIPLYRPGTNQLNVGIGNQFAGPNTYERTMLYDLNYNDQLKLITSANMSYKFNEALTASVLAGADFRETQGTSFSDPRAFDNTVSTDIRFRTGSMSESLSRFLTYNVRGTLNYRKTFAEKHEIDLSGVGEYIKESFKSLSMTGFGIDPRRPNTLAGITPGSVQNQLVANISGNRSERAYASAIGLARYTYNKKYTLNLSYRYDGSSILPEVNRYRSFYSAGAIWDMKKENWLANASKVNELTVRATYGLSANAQNFPFGDFGYLPQYSLGVDGAGNQTLVVSALGNPFGDWEFTSQTNIGVDFAFFNRRISGSVDVYNKLTEKAFASQSLSLTTGFASIQSNAAKIRNRGVEYLVNFDVVRNRDFTWTLNVNGAYNENEVMSLGQVANFQQGTSLITVGLPLGSHWEVGWAGVEPASGRPLFLDLYGNVTNTYSTANRVQNFGTFYAPWIGGFGSTLKYKGLVFEAFFNYQEGATRLNNLEFFVENPGGFLPAQIGQAQAMRFWRFPGDITANVQSPLFQNQFSSKYIQDASFLRLRTVTLGYTVPKNFLEKIKFVSSARLYATGQNLLTWTNWKGYDPEDNNNISLSEFPNPRTVTVGLDITF